MGKLREIRIYYESYEQAKHLVSELVSSSVTDVEIKLVRKKSGSNAYKHYAKYISPIFFWKDQDILISGIYDNKEIPLIAIEFSAAVYTEDHELQRADSMASALEAGCLYIKYSSMKRVSPSEHGGNKKYDFTIPYRVMFQRNGVIPFHVDWELNSINNGYLGSEQNYLACPPINDYIREIFSSVFNFIDNHEELNANWAKDYTKYLLNNPNKSVAFNEWLSILNAPITPDEMGIKTTTRTSTREGILYLKFNRFGHSMDPERGMLCYYGNLFNKINATMVLHDNNASWYKATPKEGYINDYVKKNKLTTNKDFIKMLLAAASLDSHKYFKEDNKEYDENELLVLDITDFVESNYTNINKALRTIFRYSDQFIVLDRNLKERCVLKWDRSKVDFVKGIRTDNDITELEIKLDYEEDEVTYIVAHEVLEKNGFKLIAVSYPGAQGDKAILPKSGSGRAQPRLYVDVISYYPDKNISLNESKGSFDVAGLQSDIFKLKKFKQEPIYNGALQSLLNKIEPRASMLPILISVSFCENSPSDLTRIAVSELDFFVVISKDKSKWKIFYSGPSVPFKIMEGAISLDKTFKVK